MIWSNLPQLWLRNCSFSLKYFGNIWTRLVSPVFIYLIIYLVILWHLLMLINIFCYSLLLNSAYVWLNTWLYVCFDFISLIKSDVCFLYNFCSFLRLKILSYVIIFMILVALPSLLARISLRKQLDIFIGFVHLFKSSFPPPPYLPWKGMTS